MKKVWKKIANHLSKKSDYKCSEVKNISTKTETWKITCSDLSLQIRFILSRCTTFLRRDDQVYWVKYKS